ncbi:hypothetical protein ACFOWU_10160 [Epilithonimonas zeae]|uniref:Uncharacterized protein n=1 Tax=Epilithonimonas zeae TaxID=1416779 RepID=A0A1N6GXC6_9FLAO|nr:hypothetical protein [Epilithonimonas zeae]SIO12213.1 hypothetical protein SAMN05444409_2119 [Epilithonimonas zeae]
MIKTILIATDFSLESLDVLKKVLKNKTEQNDENQYHILFVSGYDMGDSIRDLLFTTKSTIFGKIRSQEFCDAYSIINNKYPNLINKITCDIFTGSFQRTFNSYIETAAIDEAYFSSVKSKNLSKGQFDLTPYLKKCKNINAIEVLTQTPEFVPEKGRLAEVFL